MLGTAVQNLVPIAIWLAEFVHHL